MPADRSATARPIEASPIRLRAASLADAAALWKLVRDSGALDLNSQYCYLLLCRDFRDTCVVASRGSEVAGFVTAYVPPRRRDTVFVWQIGVAAAARRQGLARRLLTHLVSLPACRNVRYLEATVTPTNTASRRLFQRFAEALDVPCCIGGGFTAESFGSGNHEPEELFRIGPFSAPVPCESPTR